ncbi:hypothetical protein FRC12_010589 [Ceratobasidium sp. 428]|nr:hypothetical protein FRC12_010589 [Ceratobasidium sp. 428]
MRSFPGVLALFTVLVVRVAAVNVFERADPQCPAGSYYNGSSCQQCPSGNACPGGSSRPSQCQKGTSAAPGASSCTPCAGGTYTNQNGAPSCTTAQCGWYAAPSGGTGATQQQKCGKGSYSAAGSSSCTKCPAGSYCNSDATCAPSQCQPGRYSPAAGASDCLECPAGTYINNYGSTSCCNCCAGSFNSATSQTHCQACPEMTGPGGQGKVVVTSDPGSKSSQQCHAYKTGDPAPILTCTDSSLTMNQPTCPATTGPQPSGSFGKRSFPRGCTLKSHTRCEVKTERGGWECIDTNTTLDACGSCDNDCSAIPYVGTVQCVKGKCQVSSCREEFALHNIDGYPSCIPTTKHAYAIFEADTKLMGQS